MLLLPLASRADAPRDDSRAAFLRGVAEARQDHYVAARDAFLDAYRLFPHPSILLNLGIARIHTGEYVAAEEDLSRFLAAADSAPPEDVQNARAALDEVRRHVGTVRVRVTPRAAHATLGGVPVPLRPGGFADVRAAVGVVELRVEADGYAPVARDVTVTADAVIPVEVFLLTPAPRDAAHGGETEPGARAVHGDGGTLGYALLGAAGGAALAGGVAGFEAIGLAHDYNTPGSAHYQDRSTRDAGVAWRTSADVLFASALIVGAFGAYVLLRPSAGGVQGPPRALSLDGAAFRF